MSTLQTQVQSPVRTLGTLVWGEMIAFSRNWRSVMWTVALPVLMLLMSSNSDVSKGAGGKGVMIACGIALVTGTFSLGLMGYATVLANYRERGIFQLLRCTPVPASQLLLARLLVQLLAVLAEGVVVLVAAFLLFGVTPTVGAAAGMFGVLLLAGLAALALGQAVAALTKQAASTTAVSRVLLIGLLVLEGVGGGSRNWPDAVQTLLRWSPVKLAQDLLSSELASGRLNATGWSQVGVLAAWTLVIGFVGMRWFRWEHD